MLNLMLSPFTLYVGKCESFILSFSKMNSWNWNTFNSFIRWNTATLSIASITPIWYDAAWCPHQSEWLHCLCILRPHATSYPLLRRNKTLNSPTISKKDRIRVVFIWFSGSVHPSPREEQLRMDSLEDEVAWWRRPTKSAQFDGNVNVNSRDAPCPAVFSRENGMPSQRRTESGAFTGRDEDDGVRSCRRSMAQ